MNLIVYTCLALHAVAYDQLLPIFLHYPPQENRGSNPDVHLPFKFSGGFGLNVYISSFILLSSNLGIFSNAIDLTRALY